MIDFLSADHSSALAFTDDGDKYFKRPGYQSIYNYSSLKSAQKEAISGCEEYGPCALVIEDNVVVDSRLKKQLIQSGFSGSVKQDEKHKKTKNIDDSKSNDLDLDTSQFQIKKCALGQQRVMVLNGKVWTLGMIFM